MTTTQAYNSALISARINATALRLVDAHTTIDEATNELCRVATEHYIERHGRRSVERTRLRLDLVRAEIDLLAIAKQTGAAEAHRLLLQVAERLRDDSPRVRLGTPPARSAFPSVTRSPISGKTQRASVPSRRVALS